MYGVLAVIVGGTSWMMMIITSARMMATRAEEHFVSSVMRKINEVNQRERM
jgi:hypothetical protein